MHFWMIMKMWNNFKIEKVKLAESTKNVFKMYPNTFSKMIFPQKLQNVFKYSQNISKMYPKCIQREPFNLVLWKMLKMHLQKISKRSFKSTSVFILICAQKQNESIFHFFPKSKSFWIHILKSSKYIHFLRKKI